MKIPKDLKKQFHKGMNSYIKEMGRSLAVIMDPYEVDCPNCFEYGTLIETGNGLKEIQDFVPGDQVIDGLGNLQQVSKTFIKGGTFNFNTIHMYGNSVGISATSNHKLKVYSNLGTNYKPIIGKQVEKSISDIQKGDLVFKSIRELPKERLVERKIKWKENLTGPKKTSPEKLQLSNDLLFAIGLYIAEGVTSKGRSILYCLNNSERDVGIKVCDLWSEVCDLNYGIQDRPNSKNLVFEMYSSKLADLLDRWCGHLAGNKKIPEELYYTLNEEQTMSLISGLYTGDGHFEKNLNANVLTTISKKLAYQVYNLLLSCGYKVSIRKTNAFIDKNKVKHRDSYQIRYWNDKEYNLRGSLQDGNKLFQVVKSLDSFKKETTVYNIEVTNEHSYIAEGISVNNCIFDTVRGKSTNIYYSEFIRPVNIFVGSSVERKVYPQPFNVESAPAGIQYDPSLDNPKILRTSICPVCKGQGILTEKRFECIKGLVTWNPKGDFLDLSAGWDGENVCRIKTFKCNYALCRDAKKFIIDGVECALTSPPRTKGLGADHIVEFYTLTVKTDKSVSDHYDTDPRIIKNIHGSSSDQADSGTPNDPPTIPSDDGPW